MIDIGDTSYNPIMLTSKHIFQMKKCSSSLTSLYH